MKKTKTKKKLNKKQKIVITMTTVVVAAGGLYGYTIINKEAERKRIEASIVDIYQIPGREKIFMNGKLVPVQSDKLSVNPEQGELAQIKVVDQAYVEKGAPLFTCKNSSQIREIESLKEQVGVKSKEKTNAQDEETKIMIDEEIKALNKQISDLNKTVYSTVYAPFSGKVYLNQSNDDKSYVMILETTELYVQGQVNERDSYKINIDQGIEIKALATNEKYSGKITEIGDRPFEGGDFGQGYSSDSGMTKYEVRMSLDNQENLKNGLNVQITAFSVTTAVKVPNVSVVQEGSKYYVYKIKNQTAQKTEVKVADKKEEYYLIESGVNENDEIIKDALGRSINNGDKVYTGRDL